VSDGTVRITQRELAEIDELQRDVSWRSKRLEELKSNVKAMLLHRIPIERGRFDAKLRKIVCRNVPWKSLVLEKLGDGVADWFRKLHPARVRFDVDVVEHASEPLWKGKEERWIDLDQ
jgi:hypothetical protein